MEKKLIRTHRDLDVYELGFEIAATLCPGYYQEQSTLTCSQSNMFFETPYLLNSFSPHQYSFL